MRAVYTDNRLFAGWVRLGIYAVEVYADRTGDVFEIPDRRLGEIFAVSRPDIARTSLERLADVSPITCERLGNVWRIKWPNLLKKQFPFREDVVSPLSSASASATTSETKKEPSSRSPSAPRTPMPEAVEFAGRFRAALKARTPDAKMPTERGFARWIAEADRMYRIDDRVPAEAVELAVWLFNDTGGDAAFWRGNVRAVPKFRARFEELREHRARGERKGEKSAGSNIGDAVRSSARRRGLIGDGAGETPPVVRDDAGRLPGGEKSGS